MEWINEDYRISDNKSLISVDQVCNLLAKSYWAAERPRECIETSIANSVCYGVYHYDLQIGFARVVTDYATMYYIADVIIDEQHRGKGLGKKLIGFITEQAVYKNLLGMLLTSDAHGLYQQYGFEKNIETFMRKKRER